MKRLETKGKDTNQLLDELREIEKKKQIEHQEDDLRKRVSQRVLIAKRFVNDLKNSLPEGFKDVDLDDYGNFSFSVILNLPVKSVGGNFYPIDKKDFNLKKITNLIKRISKEFPDVRYLEITHPVRKYYKAYGESSFDGYERRYTQIIFEIHNP